MTILRHNNKLCNRVHFGTATAATAVALETSGVLRNTRSYSSTNCRLEESSSSSVVPSKDKAQLRKAALAYNQQRAAYKKQVKELRHAYQQEYAKHKAQDLAERDAALAATTRKRLERQRAKNERSFRNAILQEELQRQNAAVFEDHLLQQQEIREREHKVHQKARQLLIDELEEESKDWLTSVEEVEAAFSDPATEQLLWSRPQGVLGVPNPSLDSHFWNFEGHTWDRSKTYKTKSQVLLEKLEQEAYDQTNVDYDNFWTQDRLSALEAKQNKAQLRANVRMAGRRALLQKQSEYLSEELEGDTTGTEPPKPPPIPSLSVLGNTVAQEKEGADLLLKDPTKFFVFSSRSDEDDPSSDENYAGSSLGIPVAIRDPLRTGQPQGRVFPIAIGKLPKPDLRSEKEKKRQEREERLWAAAAGNSSEGSDENMLLAEEDREIGEAIDYEEAAANWDSDDEEWKKGLDENLDKDLLDLPREFRYKEEDIDEVIASLESKAKTIQSHVQNTIRTMEQEARSRLDRNDEAALEEDTTSPFFDKATTQQLKDLGANVEKYERLMASLTEEQLLGMFALEAKSDDAENDDTARTELFEGIPGLSKEQVAELVEMESFLRVAETEGESQ